ncbi:hypothetical protein HZC20_00570, partial [Candidatus Peregrinibacteria bacterium]|nr:hypothetical protein [Candidatus Peregrinibacteria bacterium]
SSKPNIDVTAKPKTENQKIAITLDTLPGCFRYSGFVYFDVKVVKKVKPAETQNICKSLSVQIDNTKDQIDNKKVYKYTPIFQWDPSKPTDTEQTNMDVRWTSDDPDGKFYSQIPTDAQYKYKYEDITENDNTGKLIIPPQTTQSLTTQVYYTGKGKVHAKLLADNKFRPGNCTATVTIPTIPPVCSFLNVNYQDPVYSGFTSLFSAQGADKYHQPFDSNIEYWVDDDYGTFSATIPKDQEFNPAKTIFQIKGTGPLDLTKAYIPPISGKDIGTAISNKSLPLDLFTQLISTGKLWEITSAPPSTPKIETVPTQPKKQTLPPPQPINGVTQKLETKLQLPDLIKAGSFSPPSNTETIDTTGLQTKMSYDLQPGAIHANAKTTVYFTAKKPSDGKKVIHVKALNSAKGICEQDYPIEPYQVCKSLSVNKQKTIYAQTLSTFSAKSTDKKDKTFNGKITYSVEEGYGMFYTTQQTGKTGNTSPDDPAFTKDLNQKEPKAGFCENQTLKINELKDAPTNFTQELLAKPDTAVTIELLSNETEKLPYATTPENYTVITKTKPETATKPSNITQKQEGISVVADPQDTVYFWGEKQGKEVIHISTNCTSGCTTKLLSNGHPATQTANFSKHLQIKRK